MPYAFHGIVLFAGKWLRLLTSAKHTPGTSIKEEFSGGPYQPAFLDHFFGGRYRVEVRKIHRRKFNGVVSEPPVTQRELFSGEVIRFSNSSDQYLLRIKGAKGWLSSFKEIGLIIQNSKKMSKRLVELVRLSCAWLYVPAESALKVEVIDHVALGYPDEYVDGATSISRGLAIRCIMSNTSASPTWRVRHILKIMAGQTVVVQFRMLCDLGIIKGNALIVPKGQMNGSDVRTFEPNIKSEIRTTGWQWITIEPSYGAIPVKSDDLTHSIYRNVKGLYDDDTLLSTLEESLKQFETDLKSGKRSEWMEKLADHSDDILHEDAEEKYASDRGLVGRIQLAVAQLSKLGIPLTSSQTLMYLSVNGLRKQLLGDNAQGMVWADKTRHWFPVPWAYAAHIYTQEVLEVLGYKMPKTSSGFFHEKTHSFVVPGKFFKENFSNHGGPDLDDTVKVHIRRVLFRNGHVRMMAFILRNPNDFGEWSMIPVSYPGPVFHRYGVEPPLVDMKELAQRVPQFSRYAGKLSIGQLPAIASPPQRGEVFSLEDEARVRQASEAFPPGVGGTVIPKMIWYAHFSEYLTNLVASNEDIIDVLQQGQAGEQDVTLIQQWIDRTFRTMGTRLNWKMDKFWYYTRLPAPVAEEGWEPSESSDWVTLHVDRENLVRRYIADMTAWLNANISMPDILANIKFTEEELQKAPNLVEKMKQAHQTARQSGTPWVPAFCKMMRDADIEKGQEFTDRRILLYAYQAILTKKAYPKTNHDQWLYSFSAHDEEHPYMYLVRALKRVKNGTYNW